MCCGKCKKFVMTRVYLDYNATAPLLPSVYEQMVCTLDYFGNPSSIHAEGQRSRRILEQARQKVALYLGCDEDSVIFTSGGTESNNMALRGLKDVTTIVSTIEHESVLLGCNEGILCPVTLDGLVDIEVLWSLLSGISGGVLVSVMYVNNETGIIQPIERVVERVKRRGGWVHCDATQALGRVPIHFKDLGVDLMTLSGHKLGGPKGIGVLLVRRDLPFFPLLYGGRQEGRRRAGTENVVSIVGMAKAVEESVLGLSECVERCRVLRDDLEERIRSLADDVLIVGGGTRRVANTSCLAVPFMDNQTQVIWLDLNGIAVSAGSACSSGRVHASHVLQAMDIRGDMASCAIRVSLGWGSGSEDVERFVDAYESLYRRTRKTRHIHTEHISFM